MLSALNTNQIAPKAQKAANGEAQGEANLLDALASGENTEFASELMASLTAEDLKVQPVEVPSEKALRMPSSLINLQDSSESESINPKVFDPALTQGVEKLIQPLSSEVQVEVPVMPGAPVQLTDAEVIKMAKMNPEMSSAPQMSDIEVALLAEAKPVQLAQAQVQELGNGRSPAIEFAQDEIDPQLMNMEDFVSQKNSVSKKHAPVSAYGMNKPHTHKLALESGLKSTEIVKDIHGVESHTTSAPVNSQQFLLNLSSEQGSSAPQVSDVSGTQKVFDMSQVKSENSNQIMNQITDYIVQAKAAKEPTVNMRVNHDELGMIDITVHKAGSASEAVAINIGTHTADGKNFFQSNSKDLFAHLSQAGINVSDLKVETPSQTAKNDFDFNGQQGRGGFGQDKQFGSEQNQRRHESDRRQELWNLLREDAA